MRQVFHSRQFGGETRTRRWIARRQFQRRDSPGGSIVANGRIGTEQFAGWH